MNLKYCRAFTIVELIVTITIMAIFLTLATVNLDSSRISARDTERKNDVSALAAHLETYFSNHNEYPSLAMLGVESSFLEDLDVKTITAPDETTASLVAATNNSETTTGVTPQPAINQYVYQPMQKDNSLCTIESQECRSFNIYYKLEADNTIYQLVGKHQ